LRRRSAPAPPPGAAAPAATAQSGSEEEEAKVALLLEAGVGREAALEALRREAGDVSAALLRATELETERASAAAAASASSSSVAATGASFSNDGGSGASTFAPGLRLGPTPPAQESSGPQAPFQLPGLPSAPPLPATEAGSAFLRGLGRLGSQVSEQVQGGVQAAMSSTPPSWLSGMVPGGASSSTGNGEEVEGAIGQHVDLLIPGQIIHLYRSNGLSRAAYAEASHDTFRHIHVCQDMLNDHWTRCYAEGLRQAAITEPNAPRWIPLEDHYKCACCNAAFSWAVVLQSAPQQMLARHHCFACGKGVCDGCSARRLSHPQLGFREPVRTCDRCWFSSFGDAPVS